MYQNSAKRSFICDILTLWTTVVVVSAFLALTGCASKTPGKPIQLADSSQAQTTEQDKGRVVESSADQRDFFEPVNRGIFRFNEILDGMLLKPMVHIYWGLMPEFGQKGVRNVLTNLSSPVVFLNSVLQGDAPNATRTLERFVINSTVGVAGLFDVATRMGIEKAHRKDFGQTMGVYGAGTGAYIVIPLLGPSDIRDTFGLVADVFSDPFNYIFTTDEALARAGVSGIVRRGDYMKVTDRVYRDSLDPYASLRSIYLQNRDKVVRDYLGTDSDTVKYSGK